MTASTVGNSAVLSQKIKSRTTCDPAIPLLDIYLKKMKTLVRKNIRIPTFIAALFTKVRQESNLSAH